jgi:glyoxylase-like metal-dependent hydrolase (beta-lactamase superfamily II)
MSDSSGRTCVDHPSLSVAILAVLLAPALHPATALASGDPQESFLYRNFVRASAILDRGITALGGAELLDRDLDLRISFTGVYRLEGHFARPWAHRDYRLEGEKIYSANMHAMKIETTFYDGAQATPTFSILGPSNGLLLSGGRSHPDSIPVGELENSIREELELLPQEYLRQARAGAAGLRLLAGDAGYDVVCYTLDNGEGRALFFDARTHLLTRVERIGHWTHKGDRLEWRTFADYVERDGIHVPLKSEVHVEDASGQHDVTTEISQVAFGPRAKVGQVTIPAAYRAGFEGWKLEAPAADDPLAPLPSHDLGGNVYIIDLPPSESRSLLVGFSDFAVVVEAGDRSEVSARLLVTADRLLPHKPVRYVVMTHHHPLYVCGLRPYVQRGVTVLATPGDTAYYRDLVTRPYRIHPDEQQRHPREPRFAVIDSIRVITDGKQRLELHEFGYSTHTDEFVLPYLASHKLIVTGDMVYILRDQKPGPANPRERAIDRVVEERKLDVQRIMETWFLQQSDSTVPYSALEEKVRLAEAKE